MNTVKIGQFIRMLRKENSLTQREVAERLNVSEKTISKWETGNGMPEVSLMLPLCKLFGISINELLSGERLDEKQYVKKAEENIVYLVDRTTPRKKNYYIYNFLHISNLVKPCFNSFIGLFCYANMA